jgi:hypothetical protein
MSVVCCTGSQVPKEGQEFGSEDSPGRRRRELNLEEELDLTSMQLVNALIAEKKTKAKVRAQGGVVRGHLAATGEVPRKGTADVQYKVEL